MTGAQLEDRLVRSQKLRAIGRLAGGIAHDFNNVLTAIIGFVRFALEDLPADGQAHDDLEEVLRAADHAVRLTSQLLAFSRRKTIRPQRVDLQELVPGMNRLLQRLVGEDLLVRFEVEPDTWPLHVDPTAMEQVLVNLSINARDAAPQGGTLRLCAKNRTLTAEEAAARDLTPGDYVQLTVSDDGDGIPTAVLPHVFEPFFTTKLEGRGTGLGLATCYGIAKQAGGTIDVDSMLDVGTTFTILLPRSHHELTRASSEPPRRATGHETVLVVEDNHQVRRLAVRALRSAGYTVIEASDGRAALRHPDLPRVDLVLTDVVMPRMGGPELLNELRTLCPTLRGLFMSGYASEALVRRGLEPDTVLIEKPFTPEQLTSGVRKVLDR
ncbi:MAG: ATP-binding protein [Myxococcota bacterium]